MASCPYCPIEKDPDQKVLFRGRLTLFCQNESKQGALKHSGIIIPLAHRESVFELTPAEIVDSFDLLLNVKKWMDAEFQPDGYNIGWNCGAVGGQEVFHAHMHVIPRFRQEPLAGCGFRSLLKSKQNSW